MPMPEKQQKSVSKAFRKDKERIDKEMREWDANVKRWRSQETKVRLEKYPNDWGMFSSKEEFLQHYGKKS